MNPVPSTLTRTATSGTPTSRTSWPTRVVVALLAGMALLVAAQSPGWSHAALRASSPVDGESVAEAPDLVSFTFNEPVGATTGALRVFDASGARVDDGVQTQPSPDVVEVGLGDVPDGGYVATFLVTSADGHVIRGATTFRVGTGTALDDETVAAVFAAGDGGVAVAATVGRAVDYGATLVAAGALLAALGAATTVRQRRLALHTTRIAAWTGVVATVLSVPLQAMSTSGLGFGALGSPGVLGDALTSNVGLAAMTRLAGLVLLVATASAMALPPDRRRFSPTFGLVGGATLALGSLVLDGHTRTVDPAWVMVLGDLVHVAAAAVWAGGLVVVARVVRGGTDAGSGESGVGGTRAPVVAGGSGPVGPDLVVKPEEGPDQVAPTPTEPRDTATDEARFVATFSGRAGWAMLALALAGSAMGWALVRQPRALTSTDYGWTLVAKVAVVAVIVVVAAYNRFRLVPAVEGAGPDASAGRRQLRATLGVEVVGLVVVLALTAVLVNLRPAADEAGIAGAFDTVVSLSADIDVNLVVDPNRAGRNELHIYLLDETGRPLGDDVDVSLELRQVEADIGPIERSPRPAGPGHWTLTGSELAVPGTWEVTTIVGVDRFSEERVTVEVVVNPA